MTYAYCPNCGKETGHARRLGWGTFFAALFTGGLWLFTIPLYPKRCIICGRELSKLHGFQPVNPDPVGDEGITSEEKTCPICAETIKLAALKCRYCGYEFDPEQVAREIAEAKEKAGKLRCPHCNSLGVLPHAYLPDGGLGPWCPHCKRPV